MRSGLLEAVKGAARNTLNVCKSKTGVVVGTVALASSSAFAGGGSTVTFEDLPDALEPGKLVLAAVTKYGLGQAGATALVCAVGVGFWYLRRVFWAAR